MAATYGRLTGKAGVCLATLGPGATNLVTAAAYAQLGAMPMMMITGQKPIKASKQGRFQIVDVVSMMRPITKFAKQVVNGNTIPQHRPGGIPAGRRRAAGRRAYRIARGHRRRASRRPTPLPRRQRPGGPHCDSVANRQGCRDDPFGQVSATAGRSRRQPQAYYRGAGGLRRQDGNPPIFDTQMGKGVIGRFPDLYVGTAALSDGRLSPLRHRPRRSGDQCRPRCRRETAPSSWSMGANGSST